MSIIQLEESRSLGLGDSRTLSRLPTSPWSVHDTRLKRKNRYYDSAEKFIASTYVSRSEILRENLLWNLPQLLQNTRQIFDLKDPKNMTYVNKIFACQWLDADRVILGTKCNRLLVLDTSVMRCRLQRKRAVARLERKYLNESQRMIPDDSGEHEDDEEDGGGDSGPSTSTGTRGDRDRISLSSLRMGSRMSRKRRLSGSYVSVRDCVVVDKSELEARDPPLIRNIPSLQSNADSLWYSERSMIGRIQNQPYQTAPSGIHTIQINPSRTLLATGGQTVSDLAVYSLPDFRPVAIGQGAHSDWLFDMKWLDDEYAISGSRDNTLALWRIRDHRRDDEAIGCNHTVWNRLRGTSAGVGKPFSDPYRVINPVNITKLQGIDKIRALSYNERLQQISLTSLSSTVCNVSMETCTETRRKELFGDDLEETVSLCHGLDHNMLVVGSKRMLVFMDPRSLDIVSQVPLPTQDSPHFPSYTDPFDNIPSGVRSLTMRGPQITLGTGRGDVYFYDVRSSKPDSFISCHCHPGTALRLSCGRYNRTGGFPSLNSIPITEDGHGGLGGGGGGGGFGGGLGSLDYQQRSLMAVYSLAYDQSGIRLFTAGGPISATSYGHFATLWY